MTDKFFGFFQLLDACAETGCPACRLVEDDGRRYLDSLVYEQVNDPDTRRRIRAAWGFCNWHTWMLLETANAPSGAAILYEDLVRVVLGRLQRMRDGTATFVTRALPRVFAPRRRPTIVELRRRRSICPACAWGAEAEHRYLITLTLFVDDPQLVRAYAKSDGLCVPHLVAAVDLSPGTTELGRLLDLTMPKWDALRRDLDGFICKHDYRNRIPFTEAEASSYRRAFEMVVGRRGVWGADLHGRDAPKRPDRRGSPVPTQCVSAEPATEDVERRKLETRVAELTVKLGESTSRAAALHDRLSRVAEDRDVLELDLAGERGTRALATRTIADLRAENERLRGELAAARDAARVQPRLEA